MSRPAVFAAFAALAAWLGLSRTADARALPAAPGPMGDPLPADPLPDFDVQDLIPWPAAAPQAPSVPAGAQSDDVVRVVRAGAGWTEVQLASGAIVRRTGARNWRNHNPGNIEFGAYARSRGAVGSDGRFAVFPSLEAGRAAQEALIFDGANYRDLSLSAAIARYAPPSENNTAAYARAVLAAVGGAERRMVDYSPAERAAILAAMERVEGFKVGSVQTIGSAMA